MDIKQIVLDLCAMNDEQEWFEFKENWFQPEALGEYVSALSNAAAFHYKKYAYFIWGVENENHKIVGTTFNQYCEYNKEPYQNYLARNLSPSLNFSFEEMEIKEKRVVVLVIPAAFEIPTALLYEMPVKYGSNVALKYGNINEIYRVIAIDNEKALCIREDEQAELNIDDLVVVAKFGEPIYPYLKQVDSVCNAPNTDLWHTLIEADNYHALQLLEYLYAGKVDCIYIDPPYNSGARDWKYNNDYVDGNDSYRHSKWLSMMQKRLKLAKRLLNPGDSVLIVTIDEKEYLHLGYNSY